MCFNPSPVRRVPSPNRYIAVAKFCFCKNNKRLVVVQSRMSRRNLKMMKMRKSNGGNACMG